MSARELLHALAELIADRLEGDADAREYYDQKNSPIPTSSYLRLVRAGKLTGYKVAGRVLVKRVELHAFIDAHKVEPTAGAEGASEEQALEELRRQCGLAKGGTRAA